MKINDKMGNILDIDFNKLVKGLTDSHGDLPKELILEKISFSNLEFGSKDTIMEVKIRARSHTPPLSQEEARRKFYDE